jgi:hypothetical protein
MAHCRGAEDRYRETICDAVSDELSGRRTQMSWTDSTLFLRMLVVAFRAFLWPFYQVSGRTWCKHVAPSTHPFHNTTEGQTRLQCRSTHSRLSQAAIRSSGMWHQEMLPSILHGCHFDTFSSFSKRILSRIFLIRPRIINHQPLWFQAI